MQTLQKPSPPKVRLPYRYEPRDYQLPFWQAMDNGAKRAVLVWLRRAGKDKTCFNYMVREAYKKAGGYYYMLPKYTQARKAIWDGIDALTGMKFIDHIPKEILAKKPNETEMKITIHTQDGQESIIQLVGSDRYNDLVGTPPAGIVISEWSISNPAAWEFFRPILAQNNGWAIFNYTPRGRNHGFKTYQMAKKLTADGNPDWFCQFNNADNTDAITLEAIEDERLAGMSDEMIQQEFYCSFDGSTDGAYYGSLLTAARKEGRIKEFIPVEQDIKVDTYWDFGIDDYTTIWFVQRVRSELRILHYYENSGKGMAHYAMELQNIAKERGFTYGRHIAPHDVKARSLQTGVSLQETAKGLGVEFELAPNLSLQDGIHASRLTIPKCWFDEKHCEAGLDALSNYHKEWDEINRTFKKTPKHDWSSHGADAFRMLGVSAKMLELRDEHIGNRTGKQQKKWNVRRGRHER